MKSKTVLVMIILGLNFASICSPLHGHGTVVVSDVVAASKEEKDKQTSEQKNKLRSSLWKKFLAKTGTVSVVTLVGLYSLGSFFPRGQKDVDSDDDTAASAHDPKASSVRIVNTQDIDIGTDEEDEDSQQGLNGVRRVGGRVIRGAQICVSAISYAVRSLLGLKPEPIVVRSSWYKMKQGEHFHTEE